MDQGSQRRGRIRLVAAPGGKRSRSEAVVCWSRVKAARARIAAGYYDRDDVREELLDVILEELTER